MSSDTSIGQDAAGGFNPMSVNLTAANPRDIICYLDKGTNDYNGHLGARISSIFVILIVSSAVTFFPVAATRLKSMRIPLYLYLFARYFGTGVIIATAFIHLLDPAYDEIGPASCVGMTGGWAQYSWPPSIALASAMLVFLMDFAAERYVEKKYGMPHGTSGEAANASNRGHSGSIDAGMLHYTLSRRSVTGHDRHQSLHTGDVDPASALDQEVNGPKEHLNGDVEERSITSEKEEIGFRTQIAAFLILEFGVIFHSVIIGLTLGVAGDEFPTLYPVIVFHQSFEGLGIGARLSSIPFPKRLNWMPWFLCTAYGLTTPISIAIGLGLSHTYNPESFTANVVSGVLDSISAGILLYTGFVELLARDFLFNPDRTNDDRQLAFMVCSTLLGAALMALLGKWA